MKQVFSKAETRRALARLEETYPDLSWPLRHETPFQMLVAVMLLAQSTDVQVNALTERLFKKYATPSDFAALEPEQLQEEIQELGIFRAKSEHIVGTARRLLEWYKGEVPRTQEELVRLPGVGRKTANLVLAYAYGIPVIAVDTHIQRVSNRMGISNSMNPEITEKQICQRLPRHVWIKAHLLLSRLARELCTVKNPKCGECPVADVCQFSTLLGDDQKLRAKVFVELDPSTV